MDHRSLQRCDSQGVLTPREDQALYWLAMGKTIQECAIIMGCSARTARAHADSGQEKLGASNKCMAISMAFMRGYMIQAACTLLLAVATVLSISTNSAIRTRGNNARRITQSRSVRRDSGLAEINDYSHWGKPLWLPIKTTRNA